MDFGKGEMKRSRSCELDDSVIIQVKLNIDVGAKSSMFCCIICLDLIQTPAMHRQCNSCGNTLCVTCIKALPNSDECPACRADTVFISNSLIHRDIYPAVSKSCPWPKCSVRLLNVDAHMSSCPLRTVQCPVCHSRTPIRTIHEHLNNDCVMPWKSVHRDSISDFAHELKNIGRIPGKTYQKIFDLNPAGTKDASDNTRIIYFWRKNNPKRGFIRMMCIQLCASVDEVVEYAVDQTDKHISMKVASIENFEQVEPTVEYADVVASYKHIWIHPGIHLLTCGNQYEIERTSHHGQSFKGQLIEILWNPTRAIFTDFDGNIHTAIISMSSDMNNIKKIDAINVPKFTAMRDTSTAFNPAMYQPSGSMSSGRTSAARFGEYVRDLFQSNQRQNASITDFDPYLDSDSEDAIPSMADDAVEYVSDNDVPVPNERTSENKYGGLRLGEMESKNSDISSIGRVLEPVVVRGAMLALEAAIKIRRERNQRERERQREHDHDELD